MFGSWEFILQLKHALQYFSREGEVCPFEVRFGVASILIDSSNYIFKVN